MAESYSRWESDPLFSAAEVVQDSADRMETIYRLLLHEQTLFQGDTSDAKLLSSMQFHSRDLVTALETTKWQLEDFEGAVHFAALSDKSNSRADAISRYKQFVKVIGEQIVQVEKNLQNMSAGDFNKKPQLMNSYEPDIDGLALFLSGGECTGHHVQYDSESSRMRGFCNSTSHSDGIVEIKPEDGEEMQVDYMKHNLKGLDFGSSQSWGLGEVPLGGKECEESQVQFEPYDLETSDNSTRSFSAKNRLRGSVLGYLSNFWFSNMNKLTRSFTKRRKDGEITDDLISYNDRPPSSSLNVTPVEQVYTWIDTLLRRLQRSSHLIHYGQFPVRIRLASAVLVTLVVIGLVAFHVA